MDGILVMILFATGVGTAVASLDPAFCPFELGYNPVFNADGSALFCEKGNHLLI